MLSDVPTGQAERPPESSIQVNFVQPLKYSNRVPLKAILERDDRGIGLVGQKIVIGGWIKSIKSAQNETKVQEKAQPIGDGSIAATTPSDASCVRILQAAVPFFKSIYMIFGGGDVSGNQSPASPKAKALPMLPLPRYLVLSDGSCVANLQVVIDSSFEFPGELLHAGSCLLVEGIVQQPTGKHSIELRVERFLHIGAADPDNYPLAKKRLPLETLRDCPHFRPRTTTVASVTRIRSAFVFGAHNFLQEHGFISVEAPVMTTMDIEAFNGQFQVTTLFDSPRAENTEMRNKDAATFDAVKASIKEKTDVVEKLRRTGSNKEAHIAALQDLQKTKKLALHLESKGKMKTRLPIDTNEPDFSQDFFFKKTYLTTSGRLHLESYACAMGSVYSMGPRFLASRAKSIKQMAETWMIEVEMAFSDLKDAINCAVEFFQFLCKLVLDKCLEDLKFVSKRADNTIIPRLALMSSTSCERITYSEAANILQKLEEGELGHKFPTTSYLTAEHFSFLADEIYKKPLIVSEFPKEAKQFHVRQNDGELHVAAFEMFVPQIGRLITGSQSEERLDLLEARINERSLQRDQYEWYLDLRRHGTVPHSGFSLEIDLLVLLATGLTDVRDAVPFFRSHGKANG